VTPHLGFIVAAFAVAGVVVAGMVVTILWDYSDLKARLARLERRDGD
jgi:heme exporter protein CcmD